jgi:NAD(P)-dependent dehydrogenase (short-subunit alcohol dehydrogenase family)
VTSSDRGLAIVFGASSGIGRAAAEALWGSRRYDALLTVDIAPAPGVGEREHLRADLSVERERTRVIDAVLAVPERIAALVWSVGVAEPAPPGVARWPLWREIVEVDLMAAAHVLCALHDRVVVDAAAVVVVDSTAADVGSATSPPYAAAKAGCRALSRSLAVLTGTSGARYNSLAPGPIETPLGARLAERMGTTQRVFSDRTIAKRPGSPAEVASAVEYLCSPAASYVNGTVLVVDGGYLAG